MRELSSIEKRDEAERKLNNKLLEVKKGKDFRQKILENFYGKCEREGACTGIEW